MTHPTPELPPIGLVFNGSNIPQELKAMRRWAVWKAIWNPNRGEHGKYDKVPYDQNHRGLSTKELSRWSDYESAAATLKLNPSRYHGLGLVFTDLEGVVGIDLDNCREGTTIAPWAREIVEAMGSYTEISPGGHGLRIIAHGTTELDWNNHAVGIEVYSGKGARFLTITGDTSKPRPITDAPPEVLGQLFTRYNTSRVARANVIPITMPALITELALPDVLDMDLPEATRNLLLYGPDSDVADRSGALHAAGVQLYSAGYDDATVLSILAASQPVMDIALSHRRQDEDRALAYLWVEHCQKAKPKATTKADVLADFEDLSSDPVVVAHTKKADDHRTRQEERFKLETASEFVVRRRASWIIKGLVPMATLGVIYGASGSGKSFFVLDLMAAVARAVLIKQTAEAAKGEERAGRAQWRGHKINGAKVCWVAAEGVEDMRKRVQGYCMAQSIGPSELPMEFIGESPNFLEDVDVKALIKQMRKKGKFDIVVIDTLAQVMAGGNENSGEDMGKVLAYCREITRLTGAMVILIHHSGKDESRGARGWSGLRAAADFEFEIIRADDDRVATVTKMKGGADGEEYGFRLETIVVGQDEDGDDETTCVLRFTDSSRQTIELARGPSGRQQRDIMDKAETLLALGNGVLTRTELVEVVWPERPRGDTSKRDQRKTNTGRDLTKLVAEGFLVESPSGQISFPVKSAK